MVLHDEKRVTGFNLLIRGQPSYLVSTGHVVFCQTISLICFVVFIAFFGAGFRLTNLLAL